MSTVDIRPLNTIKKDATEKRSIPFDWDELNLAVGVTIGTSTFAITVEKPSGETPIALLNDNTSILAGSRITQTRITAGTLGSIYRLTNHITTNESPAQEKEASILVEIIDK